MRLVSTAALAAAVGVAHATSQVQAGARLQALRDKVTQLTERRAVQLEEGRVCFEAIGIPSDAIDCFFVDLENEIGGLLVSAATSVNAPQRSSISVGLDDLNPESCKAAFQTRFSQCTILLARLDNADDVFAAIGTTNVTALPPACVELVDDDDDEGDELTDSAEASDKKIEFDTLATNLTAMADRCEALVPGVTTSKVKEEEENSASTGKVAVFAGMLAAFLLR